MIGYLYFTKQANYKYLIKRPSAPTIYAVLSLEAKNVFWNGLFEYCVGDVAGCGLQVVGCRVVVCRDAAAGTCRRAACRYYHIPVQLPPALRPP